MKAILTLSGILNFVLLQWVGIRLRITTCQILGQPTRLGTTSVTISVHYFICPLSGWVNSYCYIGKPHKYYIHN